VYGARPDTIADMTHVTAHDDVGAIVQSPQARQALHSTSETAELGVIDQFSRDGLPSLHGDKHFQRRRLESRLFTKQARQRMEYEILLPVLRRQLADHLAATGNGEADLMPFSRLILARLSGAIVGTPSVDDVDTAERLRGLSEQIMNGMASQFPWTTGDTDEYARAGLEARQTFRDEFYEPGKELADPYGVIGLLMQNEDVVPDEEVRFRESMLFLIGSSSTTANALPHTIVELERWLETHPERRADLDSFEFCRRAASEALRLHPPNPGLIRNILEPMTLPSGRELHEGEFVFVDLRTAGRDRSIFGDDADEFDPTRDVPDGAQPFGFTFGGGPHMCIGRTLTIGDHGAKEDPEAPQGVLVQLLHELYSWGLRRDDRHEPRFREALGRDDFETFPVVFTRAAGN
jgi:cytochrome P450